MMFCAHALLSVRKTIYSAAVSWPGIRLPKRKKGKKEKSVNNGEPGSSLGIWKRE